MSKNIGRKGHQPSRSGGRVMQSAKSRKHTRDHNITQVNLKEYEFSPPGPMGWTAREYEKMIDNLQHREGD
jgi:hypothetical protein